MHIIEKGQRNIHLEEHLTLREYECQCSYSDCTFTLTYSKTVHSFFKTRKDFGEPIKVLSAFRCQRHNADIGGYPNSRHVRGAAIDLTPLNYSDTDYDRLLYFARQFFDVVVPYRDRKFIHCHNEIA